IGRRSKCIGSELLVHEGELFRPHVCGGTDVLGSLAAAWWRSESVPVLVFFARSRRFLCRLLTVLGSSACARMATELVPVFFGHIDAVMLCRLLDIGEREFAIVFRDAGCLIEARYRIPNMARVGQRFFALFRKGEHAVR